jgi:general secretion pathway protein K
MSKQQGVALLLVLWVLALLSTLLAALAATVQLQHRQAQWMASHTQALFSAEAGLGEAVMALQARDPKARWLANGEPHAINFADTDLEVRVYSERGKLDLNAALASDVRRLLSACGATAEESEQVTQGLEHQRNGAVPLRTLEEFRELSGMSFTLYRCATPWVTVWSGQARPEPGLAGQPLVKALGLPVVQATGADPGQIFTVVSQARLPSGYATTLQVTLMLTPAKEGARPYRVLRWQE